VIRVSICSGRWLGVARQHAGRARLGPCGVSSGGRGCHRSQPPRSAQPSRISSHGRAACLAALWPVRGAMLQRADRRAACGWRCTHGGADRAGDPVDADRDAVADVLVAMWVCMTARKSVVVCKASASKAAAAVTAASAAFTASPAFALVRARCLHEAGTPPVLMVVQTPSAWHAGRCEGERCGIGCARRLDAEGVLRRDTANLAPCTCVLSPGVAPQEGM
jgi:hypothetical protein